MEMVFRRIEYWIEGDAAQQKMLKKAPWTTQKIAKKSFKWTVFWIVSFLIANTFLSYVIGVDELYKIVKEPLSEHLGGFSAILVFTSIFFFVYSWFREQVCTVVCPYGRMQGVLLDGNSLVVAYDYVRGEQRGKFRKNMERTEGDCIDCMQCVKVCPTGIDIRNGTQLECINCTACIDACDHMMTAVGFDTGLIRLASENNIAEKKPFRFTGRVKAYSVVMVLLLGVLVFLLASRADVGITLLRTPGQLYQEYTDGNLSNLYNYKFLNKTYHDMELTLRPENFNGRLKIVGDNRLLVPKEGFVSGSMFVFLKETDVSKRKTPLKIGVYDGDKKIETISTTFLGPFGGN
jgi:cytochrome c oxidase accessory protein FixG